MPRPTDILRGEKMVLPMALLWTSSCILGFKAFSRESEVRVKRCHDLGFMSGVRPDKQLVVSN